MRRNSRRKRFGHTEGMNIKIVTKRKKKGKPENKENEMTDNNNQENQQHAKTK